MCSRWRWEQQIIYGYRNDRTFGLIGPDRQPNKQTCLRCGWDRQVTQRGSKSWLFGLHPLVAVRTQQVCNQTHSLITNRPSVCAGRDHIKHWFIPTLIKLLTLRVPFRRRYRSPLNFGSLAASKQRLWSAVSEPKPAGLYWLVFKCIFAFEQNTERDRKNDSLEANSLIIQWKNSKINIIK